MIVRSQTNLGIVGPRDIYKRVKGSKLIQYSLIALAAAFVIMKVL